MTQNYSAILIDDESTKLKGLSERWKDVFNRANLQVNIVTSSDFELGKPGLAVRPHFVIVDNVLATTEDGKAREIENRGVDFIVEHKPEHGDTIFILSTKASFSIDVLGQKFPNPDLIVPKTTLSSETYRANLSKIIASKVMRTPYGRLNIPDPNDLCKVETFMPELESILEQCIHSVARQPAVSEVKQVNLESLTGGLSGSLVFRAKLFDAGNRQKVPLVLKIAKGIASSREVDCYNHYVRLNMPHDMRVDLLGYGEAGDYKGALYAFAFGEAADLVSLSKHIRAGNYQYIQNVIDRFFLSPDVGWYKECKSKKTAEDFFSNSEEYSHEKDSRRLDEMKKLAIDLFGPDNVEVTLETIRVGAFRFAFIRKVLEKFDSKMVPECICHGDFNSNNIIFGRENAAISTIDFEFSGIDIFYKDFISLECSLRVEDLTMAPDTVANVTRLVSQEVAILEGRALEEKGAKYISYVQLIRKAAQESIEKAGGKYQPEVYCLALSFHLLKLVGVKGISTPARWQLLSAFIACGLQLKSV